MSSPTVAWPSSADAAAAIPAADTRRIVVEAWRGDTVESRHEVWCAILPVGALAAVDAPEVVAASAWPRTCMRSTAKPFQLLPLVVAGGAARFGLAAADLAVMAASHDGTDAHAERVAAILARMGLDPGVLRCGLHRPYYLDALPPEHPERQRLFGPLHNNCSGNHAALLGLALLHDVAPGDYLRADGAGQARAHAAVEALSGVTPTLVDDDCGSPCYAVPLPALAEAYRFLAEPERIHDLPASRLARLARVGAPDAVAAALHRIAEAMASEPEWVSGATSGATRLARTFPGEIVAKYGAEGVLCVAHRSRGAAVALKVADGNSRALMPAMLALASGMDWMPPSVATTLGDLIAPPILGRVGQIVGLLRVAS